MSMNDDIKTVLVSEEQLKAKVAELGARISKDYEGKNLVLVSILKGSVVFMADLMRAVTIPCSIDFMVVSSYGGSNTVTSGLVKIIKDLDGDLSGKDVLIVEDILDTGVTLSKLVPMLKMRRRGKAVVALKGKVRTILLPEKLCKKLLKYVKRQKITSGEVFLTGGGKRLSRVQIWAEMKRLCCAAGVAADKVFPHNLRHLFARTFYRACQDVVKLADILGHSSIETTRIYLLTTGTEHLRRLERLGLLC